MAHHDPSDSISPRNRLVWFGIRFALVLVCVALAAWGFDWLKAQIALLESDASARAMTGLIVAVLVVYALLLAMPFVPGVEIGVALLIIQGPTAAPLVYGATLGGLALAFIVGQTVSLLWLIRQLQDLRLRRIAGWLERIDAVPRGDRLAAMQAKLPRWLAPVVVKYRYATLAIAINTPGNIAVGGGGGIMLVAGLSRLFSTPATLLVIALATTPVPLAVWLWGVDVVR